MLENHIKSIREGIKSGHYINQASISQGIVLRILQALSWPTYDVKVVFPEYPFNGRRVDYALCHPPGKPIALIEIKPPGQSSAGERQLFEYAFHKGVPIAILTDGQEWHFFLPAEPGDYGERRVYKLDIVEREIQESEKRMERYLKYDAVCSGAALEAARADYRDVAKDRLIKATLPKALSNLIDEEEELFLELVADQVESLCGYKPDLDTVADFLKANVSIGLTVQVTQPVIPSPSKKITLPPQPLTSQGVGFNLLGTWYPAKNAREVLVNVFLRLAEKDQHFLDRFAGLPRHGTKRRYLARSPEQLYPHRSDLAREHSHELPNEWWLVVHLSRKAIKKIIIMACEVAQLKFGTDLKINLGE